MMSLGMTLSRTFFAQIDILLTCQVWRIIAALYDFLSDTFETGRNTSAMARTLTFLDGDSPLLCFLTAKRALLISMTFPLLQNFMRSFCTLSSLVLKSFTRGWACFSFVTTKKQRIAFRLSLITILSRQETKNQPVPDHLYVRCKSKLGCFFIPLDVTLHDINGVLCLLATTRTSTHVWHFRHVFLR